MEPILEVKDLQVRYGRNPVVNDVSFELEKGDYLALVGANGSGKTTIINTILGLKEKSKGSIKLKEGVKLGYLPQISFDGGKNFPACVSEIVETGLLVEKGFFKFYNKADKTRVKDILIKLDIEDLAYKKIGELSGGQQQRVHLARALVSNPEIIVLDEPANYLDRESKEDLYRILADINKTHGVTIIMVSHDLDSIRNDINKILLVETSLKFFGTMIEYEKVRKLYE